MKTDLNSEIKAIPCVTPAAGITGNSTTTGATIDSKGYQSLTFVASTGVVTDGTFAGTVFAGNAANMSDEAALVAADLIGPGTAAIDLATTDDGVCERVGVNLQRVAKRYYRIKFVQAGATTGGFLACLAILGSPSFAPVASP